MNAKKTEKQQFSNGSVTESFSDFIKIIPLVDKVAKIANKVSDILDMGQRKKRLQCDIVEFAVDLSNDEFNSWANEDNFDLFRRFLCDKQEFTDKEIDELKNEIQKRRKQEDERLNIKK